MRDIPAGFGHYRDILSRIAEYRPAGKFLQFRCLMPDRHRNGDQNWSGLAWIGDRGELVCRCLGCGASWQEFVEAVGLPKTEWFPDKGRKCGRATTWRKPIMSKIVATYDYRDSEGNLVFQKVRFEPKGFTQRRPIPASVRKKMEIPNDAKDCWVWGLTEGEYGRKSQDGKYDLYRVEDGHQMSVQLPAVEGLLYRLPELMNANSEPPVFLVEGEKDVEALRTLGFVATCTPGGSASTDPDWFLPLSGRRVVVVADNDPPGRAHAYACVAWLFRAYAREIRVIEHNVGGYEVPDKGDVSDFLSKFGTSQERKSAIIDIAKKIPAYKIGS